MQKKARGARVAQCVRRNEKVTLRLGSLVRYSRIRVERFTGDDLQIIRVEDEVTHRNELTRRSAGWLLMTVLAFLRLFHGP
jgi:hypothetical protein